MGYLPTVFSPTAYALINTLSTFTDGDVTVSASSVYKTGCEVWRAFDGKTGGMDTDSYSPASGLKECHIDIEFAKARTVEYLYFTLCTKGNNVMEVILQSSDDGVAYDNIGTYNFTYTSTGKHKLVADNYKARKYYRLKFIATTYAIQTSGQYSGYIDDVQLYGY